MLSGGFLLLAATLFLALGALAADPNLMVATLQQQIALTTRDKSIANVALVTVDAKGFRSDATSAAGSLSGDGRVAMLIDSAIRGNAFSEVLLCAVTQRLIERSLLPQADEAVWRTLLPKGASFSNPNFLGTAVTLRQLMTHTSSIVDTDRFLQLPFAVSAGNSVSDLRKFCEDYFLISVGGNFGVAQAIWGTAQPGLPASYKYARSNIALVGYIVQQAITLNPSTVVGSTKTVGALIQELLTAPLGMTSTYFLLPDGKQPFVQTALSQMNGRRVAEATSQTIHAAYVADFMIITSASDIARLMNAFVVQDGSSWRTTATAMRAAFVAIPSAATTSTPWIAKQGYGLIAFNVATMCAQWAATLAKAGSACPLSTTRDVVGFLSVGAISTVAAACTTDPATTGLIATTSTCVSVVLGSSSQSTTPPVANHALGLLTDGFRQAFSTESEAASNTIITPNDQRQGSLYGFTVFVGVLALLVVVFLSTYLIEFVVRPTPVAGNLATMAYPQLDLSAVDEIYETNQSGFW